MSEPALRLRGVTRTYGAFRAVDGIDLDVPRGCVFGLLGPNGAGKTSTIRMIVGLVPPDTGQVEVLGGPAGLEANRRVGYLPEERGLYRKMKVIDQLLFLAQAKGLERGEARRRALAWLERFDLASWAGKRTEELSKGMQQKVQFVSTVLHEPEVLVLDEPFSGLDPVGAGALKEEILSARAKGRTVVFSTHVMEQAEALCDRIALIDRGRKVLDGELAAVKDQFGGNRWDLEVDGDPSPLARVAGVKSTAPLPKGKVEVELEEGTDPRTFLRAALDEVHVRAFGRRNRPLEEIFLEVVNHGPR